ncbi:MAG: chromosomal replication initiator DnaA [Pseudomonadota bacterium]
MPQQLGLDLPSRTALGRDAFFVSPANGIALTLIDDWPNWAGGKLVLTGPKGAGKTHLTHVWAQMTGARIVAARDLTDADVPELARSPVAVEDVPEIAGDLAAQTALFHLHNLALAERQPLLFTGTGPVAAWTLTLPDLQSRLQGANAVALEPPDDALLSAVLVKLFADRQLMPKADFIPFLLSRMDRSFAAASALVEALDKASLALKRPVTRRLASEVLDNPARWLTY